MEKQKDIRIKLTWKSKFEGLIHEGYVDGERRFTIERGIKDNKVYGTCLKDHKKSNNGFYYNYPATDVRNAKKIARDIINGVNLEKHEKSRLELKVIKAAHNKKFTKLMNRVEIIIKNKK